MTHQGKQLRLDARPLSGVYVGQTVILRLEELPGEAVGGESIFPAVPGAILETKKGSYSARLIPTKAGTLLIPSVKIKLGDRVWSSNAVQIKVSPVPIAGRPSSYRGGVGPLELEARWQKSEVEQGETVELLLISRGDGVVGQEQPALLPVAIPRGDARVEQGAVEVVPDPPTRVERFRVRPLEPGELAFERFVCSSFEPAQQKFLTYGVSIPPLKVRSIQGQHRDSGQPSVTNQREVWKKWMGLSALATALAFLTAGLILWRWFWRTTPESTGNPGNQYGSARRQAMLWPLEEPSSLFARRVLNTLSAVVYLRRQRIVKVLTPSEAREFLGVLHPDPELGIAVERLVARCEQTIYGRGTIVNPDFESGNKLLRNDLVSLLEALERQPHQG